MIASFVRQTLDSPTRDVPVAVLSPLESGEFVVDPDDLAWDLLGRARLHVIRDHRLTFELSDAVGDRRMSCYWGAVRAYMPGWSRHDDPRDHPLLIADRLADPVMRSAWLGELGICLGGQLRLPATLTARIPPAAAPARAPETGGRAAAADDGGKRQRGTPSVKAAAEAAPQPAGAETAAAGVPTPDPTPLLRTLLEEVRGMAALVGHLSDEVERLRTISAVRSSSTTAIERRLGRLEDLIEEALPIGRQLAADATVGELEAADEPADATGEAGASLVDVVRSAAESYSDALLILDSAAEAAADSPYEDPERVRAVLEAMTRVARRRRDGQLGTSLRDAFADLGLDYRAAIARTTSARLREQYRFPLGDGRVVEAEEHIVLGNTYDPRRCLRIYFSSRVPDEPRLVIAHVGRHFEVKSTT